MFYDSKFEKYFQIEMKSSDSQMKFPFSYTHVHFTEFTSTEYRERRILVEHFERFQETTIRVLQNTRCSKLFPKLIPPDNHLIIQLECTGNGGCPGHKSYNKIHTISRQTSFSSTEFSYVRISP